LAACKELLEKERSAQQRAHAELAATKENLELATVALKQVLDIAAEEKKELQRALDASRAELAAVRGELAKTDRTESADTCSTCASTIAESPEEAASVEKPLLQDKSGRVRWRDVLGAMFRLY
jgi:DNA repair exonuclease SbcCD ATPase subunit